MHSTESRNVDKWLSKATWLHKETEWFQPINIAYSNKPLRKEIQLNKTTISAGNLHAVNRIDKKETKGEISRRHDCRVFNELESRWDLIVWEIKSMFHFIFKV